MFILLTCKKNLQRVIKSVSVSRHSFFRCGLMLEITGLVTTFIVLNLFHSSALGYIYVNWSTMRRQLVQMRMFCTFSV